ncbi:hypothetical protein [Leuconostoc citreum]|uniref:hypothetical protein n=1 Tax=Leuconostoc citreum TaxID=33964 RepID=UPI0032DEF3ED
MADMNIRYFGYVFVLFLILYFIKEQFEHRQFNRLKFFIIPIFAFYQFLSNIKIDDVVDIVLLIATLVLGTLIGFIQTFNFEIDVQNVDTHYFVTDSHNQKMPITREVYFVKGGLSYLIGWIGIFSIQIAVSLYFHEITFNEVEHELVNELISDIVIFLRFNDHKSWWIWELLSVSNYAYYVFLTKRNAVFKRAIKSSKASAPV